MSRSQFASRSVIPETIIETSFRDGIHRRVRLVFIFTRFARSHETMFLHQVGNLLRTDKTISNFINGDFISPDDGQVMNNFNPSNGELVCIFPTSTKIDVENAVKAANGALFSWSTVPKRERCRFLLRLADLLEKRSEDMNRAAVLDQGKTVDNNNDEYCCEANNARLLVSQAISTLDQSTSEYGVLSYSAHHPLGVVAIVTSWARPVHSILSHLVPALACGNCVVIKPSSLAPLCVHLLAKAVKDAGIPKGVVNIVYGKGDVVGRELALHAGVQGIALVGSEKTASSLCIESALRVKRLSFELGNCHAMIVCDDADLDKVVPTVIRASFLCMAGQHPHSVNRIFVHSSIEETFTERVIAAAKKLKIGNPQDPNVQMGPLISKERHQKVLSCIQGAINDGATLLYGGKVPKMDSKSEKGFFLEPTVLGGFKTATDNPINVMEVQGPVIRIIRFHIESEATKGANATPYGLSASIWSSNGGRAHRMAKLIDAGLVWINSWLLNSPSMPQGGQKQSGNGRSGGRLSLDFYTQMTTVAVPL